MHRSREISIFMVLPFHSRFVHLDPLLHGDLLTQFADQIIGDILHLFESDAAFAHVELVFAAFGVFIFPPLSQVLIGIDSHVRETDVSLGITQPCEWEWFAGLAVISVRVDRVGDRIPDTTPGDDFFISFWEVVLDNVSELVHRFLSI